MQKNIGTIDRTIRLIAGFTLLFLGYHLHTWWGLVGIVPILTAFMGWCPAYSPVRIDTRSRER